MNQYNDNFPYLFIAHADTKEVLTQASGSSYNEINTSSIQDILIQNTGRFCERFCSDLFITWKCVEEILKKPIDQNHIIVFAIRKNGVDSNTFLNCNLDPDNYNSEYYRKIYTLLIKKNKNDIIHCELKDVTSDIYYIYQKNSKN